MIVTILEGNELVHHLQVPCQPYRSLDVLNQHRIPGWKLAERWSPPMAGARVGWGESFTSYKWSNKHTAMGEKKGVGFQTIWTHIIYTTIFSKHVIMDYDFKNRSIWVFPKIVGKLPPNHPWIHRAFPLFSPSIFLYHYFWKHPYKWIFLGRRAVAPLHQLHQQKKPSLERKAPSFPNTRKKDLARNKTWTFGFFLLIKCFLSGKGSFVHFRVCFLIFERSSVTYDSDIYLGELLFNDLKWCFHPLEWGCPRRQWHLYRNESRNITTIYGCKCLGWHKSFRLWGSL